MKLFSILCTFFLTLLAGSCKKSSAGNDITPVNPAPDTLTSGWTKINARQGLSLSNGGDICFRNNDTGYLGSANGPFLKSVNGGLNWDSIAPFAATNICISQDNKVFGVSYTRNSIWRSIDQGITFAEQVISINPQEISMAGSDTGIYIRGSQVMLTTNGGDNWSQVSAFPDNNITNSPVSLNMFNSEHAWIAYGNKIFHPTGNLNSPWVLETIVPPLNNWGISSIFATSATTVYVSSYSGYVYRSVDGGVNFSFLAKPQTVYHSSAISDIHFVNENLGWMSVGSRIYKTIDAGNTWTLVVALGNTDFVELYFTDGSHGWACCNDGSVLKFN